MTIKESLDVLAGWIEERTREKRYPEREVKELSKALLDIRDMAEDQLIRHKWPEEKPTYDQDNPKQYLVLDCTFEKASYHPDGYFWTFEYGQEYILEDVSYWWNLPEVTE